MINRNAGGSLPREIARDVSSRLLQARTDRQGVILLAVLVFIALLLPLITLVMTSISTESVATAEMIKGAKSELAAEKAINDSISLVVSEKALPSYWTSAAQPSRAIDVINPATGLRRDRDSMGMAGNAGEDGIYGTMDDYWVGPRLDGSVIDSDFAGFLDESNRVYRWDFNFSEMHGPTYLGQSWSFASDNKPFAYSAFTGDPIGFFNQYPAVVADQDADFMDEGYAADEDDPFDGLPNDALLYGPGYYPGAPEPQSRNLSDGNIEDYMYDARVNLYQSIYTDLDRGPMPSSLLKSYANVTDEAGRLNLNLFCKKLPVYMPESAETDYDFDGYGTNDFNMNGAFDESGWKWMDNPLFPDRDSNLKVYLNPATGEFVDSAGREEYTAAFDPEQIDFGGISLAGVFEDTLDDYGWPELGETAQHYYTSLDDDGNDIPDSIDACRVSLKMLMEVPGMTPQLAAEILEYLNPTQAWFAERSEELYGTYDTNYYNPDSGSWPPNIIAGTRDLDREDACNITPALIALDISTSGTGTVDDFAWNFERSPDDDLPLPPPRLLASVEELRGLPGMSDSKLDRIREHVTIFSYDTNVIANYIQDVAPDADMVNAYTLGDPQYNGQVARTVPDELIDTDNVADLRWDVDRFVFAANMSDYTETAAEMYAFLREHLPRPYFDKATLPAVDRMGRADPLDHRRSNAHPIYDPMDLDIANGDSPIPLIPHRDDIENTDGMSHPYNVGESGHQWERSDSFATYPGSGYPAQNPEFTLDSCLSILMYRNGTGEDQDAFTYNPNISPDGSDPWPPAASRGLSFLPFGGLFFARIGGPFADILRSLLEANNNPYPYAGYNRNPVVLPRGPGVVTIENLFNYGAFDSPADVLEVPLYKFGQMSVNMMADPPSDYRADLNGNNSVDVGHPETDDVNYYLAFSDVQGVGWYADNIAGPDLILGTMDDPPQDVPLYVLYFTIGNRPNLDYDNAGDWEAVIPLTAENLQIVGGAEGRNQVYIKARDNFNNLEFLGPQFTSSPGFAGTTGSAGSLTWTYDWRNVPLNEADAPGGVGSAPDNRPSNANYWPGAMPSPIADYELAWAYDGNGDPYITARVEAVDVSGITGGWVDVDDTPGIGTADDSLRADDVTQVFLQYNEDAEVPFRVDVLPVRLDGGMYEIRSAYGGARSVGGSYVLFDWVYSNAVGDPPGGTFLADVPEGYDGTLPVAQSTQFGNSTIIRITPEFEGITLHAYDLRVFDDSIGGWNPNVPVPSISGRPTLDPRMYNSGRVVPPPPTDTGFPSVGWGGTRDAQGYPIRDGFGDWAPGYHRSSVQLDPTLLGASIRANITAIEPSVYATDTDVPFRLTAGGGSSPYHYRIAVLNGNWNGPDNAGNASTWPGLGTPTRSSDMDPAGNQWRLSTINPYVPGDVLWLGPQVQINDIQEIVNYDFSPSGLDLVNQFGSGNYWVELRLWDGDPTTAPDATAYTAITVGADRAPRGSSGEPPNMNASIDLRDLGDGRKGFVCDVAVDGGQGPYGYYWAVTRPSYSPGDVINDVYVVDSAGPPWFNIDSTLPPATGASHPMESNEANPTFEFHTQDVYNNNTDLAGSDGIPDANGIYFVHCYVLDNTSTSNTFAQRTLAHDVAMVTIADTPETEAGAFGLDTLARTPMAVLHAYPPGNISRAVGSNDTTTGGVTADRPFIRTDIANTYPVNPDVAGIGDVVVIRGYQFDLVENRNRVRFGGNVEATPFHVANTVPAVSVDVDGDGTAEPQMEMWVTVPAGANSGYLTVSTLDAVGDLVGTSERAFFQTNFRVNFNLVGELSPDDPEYLVYELDFQGDGSFDYMFDSAAVSGSDNTIQTSHDYASDGIGNYTATLVVTDKISGRKQTSHQLITIQDKRASAGAQTITIINSVADGFGLTAGNWVLTDANGFFLTQGVDDDLPTADGIVDLVVNLTTGATANVVQAFSNNELYVSTDLGLNPGDAYEVRRQRDTDFTNAMLANIWPEIDNRIESFSAGSMDDVAFMSDVGGAGTGLYYKWQIDSNVRRGTGTQVIEGSGTVTRHNAANPTSYLIDDTNNLWALLPVGTRVVNLSTGAEGIVTGLGPDINTVIIGQVDGAVGLQGGSSYVLSGSASAASANQLIDGSVNFDNLGVLVGDPLLNTTSADGFIATAVAGNTITCGVPGFTAGDNYEINLPPTEWRVGEQYGYYESGNDDIAVEATADADYATLNAPIKYGIDLIFPYDLAQGVATRVDIDWDANGTTDEVQYIGISTKDADPSGGNGFENEHMSVTHVFETVPAQAPRFNLFVTPSSGIPVSYGTYQFPWVNFDFDDFGNYLYNGDLHLNSWDNATWHKVTMTCGYSSLFDLVEGSAGGGNTVRRYYQASDQMMIPPGQGSLRDTLVTWTSYSPPFLSSNYPQATTMRHQAVHGSGALNWISDTNADTFSDVTGDNPMDNYQFLAPNANNQMWFQHNGSVSYEGPSFPSGVPGVVRVQGGTTSAYVASRGVYNTFGFVADALPMSSSDPAASFEGSFSFDSQPLFLGDRSGGTSADTIGTRADHSIQPLLGNAAQSVRLTPQFTPSSQMGYIWHVQYFDNNTGLWQDIGIGAPYGDASLPLGGSSGQSFPIFSADDIVDEAWFTQPPTTYDGFNATAGAPFGRIRTWLELVDNGGSRFLTGTREYQFKSGQFAVYVMAEPPSGSVGDPINYWLSIDGGTPPFDVTIDFGDGTTTVTQVNSRQLSMGHAYGDPGSYTVRVDVVDAGSNAAVNAFSPAQSEDVTTVEIADNIPLNIDFICDPPSGVAPFNLSVHYTASGGTPLSNGEYAVFASLVNGNGSVVGFESRSEANSFGPNNRLDLTLGSDDEPIQFIVPSQGIYYLEMSVSDNSGRIIDRRTNVFASGYLTPIRYGEIKPQVVRDQEGRPMHAARIWKDPWISLHGDESDFVNQMNVDGNDFPYGGRLVESDLQIFGDLLTIDPNQSFRSFGMFAVDDPVNQPRYYSNYTQSTTGQENIQDFYDTYSFGRVNLNTAGKAALTSVFRRIKTSRSYEAIDSIEYPAGSGNMVRWARNPGGDRYISAAQAERLADLVIEYRNAFYDQYKPELGSSSPDDSIYAKQNSPLGDLRVDHLPVIGPFDGVNPHDYDINDRDASLLEPNDGDLNNAWNHVGAQYYNIDPNEEDFMFYSPSDVAVVRNRYHMSVGLDIDGDLIPDFTQDMMEPASNYAKYLNDTSTNLRWDQLGRNGAAGIADWQATGLYPDAGNYYSQWSFDARNYFTYTPTSEYTDLTLDFTFDLINADFSTTGFVSDLEEDHVNGLNRMAIIDSNGITAYAYVPNPPFRSVFDLYKVIDPVLVNALTAPNTFALDATSDASLALNADERTTTRQLYSGPSAFRYEAWWDDQTGQFITYNNYLDDISSMLTCRSYVFRIEANGSVVSSGGSDSGTVDTSKLSRSRSKVAVIDVGPLWSSRDVTNLSPEEQRLGQWAPEAQQSYKILYYRDSSD